MMNFCTLFDINYLSRGLALYSSLKSNCNDFHLYIFAFDEKCELILKKLNLENVTVISLKDFEDRTLLKIKQERSTVEYFWTCTPSTILFVLNNFGIESCTYIDADLFFYSSPNVLFDELTDDESVIISEHRFTDIYEYIIVSGIYCVQFMTFKNDNNGLKALMWWRNACNSWCYNKLENGKFGDQKYLDDWPERFKGIHVLKHLGAGIAPWNVQQYNFEIKSDKLYGKEKSTGNTFDVIFYHFHQVKYLPDRKYSISNYQISDEVRKIIYLPYLLRLTNLENQVKILENELIKT